MTQWAKAVIFTEKGIVATKGCKPKFEELTAYFKAYESRDETIGRGTHRNTLGFVLLGEHYDVHRYHPPLVYGRRGNAETGEGISCAVGKSKKGEKTYLLITYILPIISARAVPQQINFYNDFSTKSVM
jgi:hypothetical protein